MIEYFKTLQDQILNKTLYTNKYKTNSKGIILACYFNPYNSSLRHFIFMKWYETIKHLPHYIIEGTYKSDKYNLTDVDISNKMIINLESRLWHKEALLNKGIEELSKRKNKPKFVFWLDTDIRFTNLNWFNDSCEKLESGANFIQPFKIIKHLNKDEDFLTAKIPESILSNNAEFFINMSVNNSRLKETDVWYSFGYRHTEGLSNSRNYENHGHVGMAWGARMDILEKIKLYDKAIIGGGDHVIAHAVAGDCNHCCISKSFGEESDLQEYSLKLGAYAKGKLTYTEGVIFHEWHGNIEKRDYYNRITYSGKKIKEKMSSENGFYKSENEDLYTSYMLTREVLDDTSDYYETQNETLEQNDFSGFSGGSFGGGGASGSWKEDLVENPPVESFTNPEIINTFS